MPMGKKSVVFNSNIFISDGKDWLSFFQKCDFSYAHHLGVGERVSILPLKWALVILYFNNSSIVAINGKRAIQQKQLADSKPG